MSWGSLVRDDIVQIPNLEVLETLILDQAVIEFKDVDVDEFTGKDVTITEELKLDYNDSGDPAILQGQGTGIINECNLTNCILDSTNTVEANIEIDGGTIKDVTLDECMVINGGSLTFSGAVLDGTDTGGSGTGIISNVIMDTNIILENADGNCKIDGVPVDNSTLTGCIIDGTNNTITNVVPSTLTDINLENCRVTSGADLYSQNATLSGLETSTDTNDRGILDNFKLTNCDISDSLDLNGATLTSCVLDSCSVAPSSIFTFTGSNIDGQNTGTLINSIIDPSCDVQATIDLKDETLDGDTVINGDISGTNDSGGKSTLRNFEITTSNEVVGLDWNTGKANSNNYLTNCRTGGVNYQGFDTSQNPMLGNGSDWGIESAFPCLLSRGHLTLSDNSVVVIKPYDPIAGSQITTTDAYSYDYRIRLIGTWAPSSNSNSLLISPFYNYLDFKYNTKAWLNNSSSNAYNVNSLFGFQINIGDNGKTFRFVLDANMYSDYTDVGAVTFDGTFTYWRSDANVGSGTLNNMKIVGGAAVNTSTIAQQGIQIGPSDSNFSNLNFVYKIYAI